MLEDFYRLQERLQVRFLFLFFLRNAGTPLPHKPATTEMCLVLHGPTPFPGEGHPLPARPACSQGCSLPASSHSLGLPLLKGSPAPD